MTTEHRVLIRIGLCVSACACGIPGGNRCPKQLPKPMAFAVTKAI